MGYLKKSLVSMLLLCAWNVPVSAYTAAIENEGQTIYYGSFNSSNHSCHVAPGGYSGDIVIPATVMYNGETYDVTHIDQQAFQNCSDLNSVVIGDNVTDIMMWAFQNSGVSSVTFGKKVKYIYAGSFSNCQNLESVFLPSNVQDISPEAFIQCDNLESIEVESGSEYYVSVDGVLYTKDMAKLHTCPAKAGFTNYVIPDGVKQILNGAFAGNSTLATVSIPNSVTYLGLDVFLGCSALTSLTIPEGISVVYSSLLRGCTSLTSVTIPESVTSIGASAFEGCTSLTKITWPENVTFIGERAFYGCTSLKEIVSLNTTPPDAASNYYQIFYDVPRDCIMRVPDESVASYKSVWRWSAWDSRLIVGYEYDVDDNQDFSLNYNVDFNEIRYTRTFNNTNLQPLYVPFAMSYTDWGEDFDVYRINAFHEYDRDDDGVVDERVLEVIRVTETYGDLEANTPYMIKAKTAGEKTLAVKDATLYAAAESSIDCSTMETKYTFTGTYSKMTGLKTAGYYCMSGGKLCPVASDAVELGAFRWYLKAEGRSGKQSAPTMANIRVRVVGEDDATGIEEIAPVENPRSGSYNLAGQKVGGDYKGIVIRNGKKMFVK